VTKKGSLFTKLLFIFFSAGVAMIISVVASFHFMADKPYKRQVHRNLKTYAKLLIEKHLDKKDIKPDLKEAGLDMIVKDMVEAGKYVRFRWGKKLDFKKIDKHVAIAHHKKQFIIRVAYLPDVYYIWNTDYADHSKNWKALALGLFLSLIILALTYHIVQRILKPIRDIEAGSERFGKGDFDQDIPACGATELGRLANSINQMGSNIKNMLDAKRDLLLAIGHELKTPLSRARINIEMLDDQSKKEQLIEEVNEIQHIIDSLLEAERANGHNHLNLEETNLNSMLTEFEQGRVKVITPSDSISKQLDARRIKLAIQNLVDNALKYSQDEVKVILGINDHIFIEVIDQGPGIAEDEFERITDAFYRPDSARSRDHGGVGLGLYLVKSVVESHHGSVEFKNLNPGLKVTLKLPLT
jgi:signal transduction histidine kinase